MGRNNARSQPGNPARQPANGKEPESVPIADFRQLQVANFNLRQQNLTLKRANAQLTLSLAEVKNRELNGEVAQNMTWLKAGGFLQPMQQAPGAAPASPSPPLAEVPAEAPPLPPA